MHITSFPNIVDVCLNRHVSKSVKFWYNTHFHTHIHNTCMFVSILIYLLGSILALVLYLYFHEVYVREWDWVCWRVWVRNTIATTSHQAHDTLSFSGDLQWEHFNVFWNWKSRIYYICMLCYLRNYCLIIRMCLWLKSSIYENLLLVQLGMSNRLLANWKNLKLFIEHGNYSSNIYSFQKIMQFCIKIQYIR